MSDIRKRSLKATTWIYIGFGIGAINTYFLTHKNWFATEQNGLTRVMIEISQLIFAFSSFGVTSFLYKFFPYYSNNVSSKKNDMLGLALIVGLIGFLLTSCGLFLLENLIIRKFSANALLLVEYFYWIVPMGFLVLIYNILEAYAYGFDKGVFTTLLRETILRLYTCAAILLKVFGFIEFRTFIILFAFQYAAIIAFLAVQLAMEKKLWITFRPSRVTIKFRKKILAIMGLTFVVVIVNVLRQSIDGLVLAAKQNLDKVGIFGLAAYMVSVLQAPFRSIIAVAVPILSRAWREKNLVEINRIYQRSSINLLTFSLFVFFCIWLNFTNAIQFFGINPAYLEGKWVFFILGIVTIIEMGTGVNGHIIGTSTFWRFELWTSILLTSLMIPLSYVLTLKYAIFGPALANLVSFSIYNFIRYWFLWNKFQMQPFTSKTFEVIIISGIAFSCTWLIFRNQGGILTIISSTFLFSLLYIGLIYWRNITPDLKPIINSTLKRLGIKSGN